jgi:hypothetical protein
MAGRCPVRISARTPETLAEDFVVVFVSISSRIISGKHLKLYHEPVLLYNFQVSIYHKPIIGHHVARVTCGAFK